jgi:hypothetical protein
MCRSWSSTPSFATIRARWARPPLTRKASYREWGDPALGKSPENAVAKCWTRGRCQGYQVRVKAEIR